MLRRTVTYIFRPSTHIDIEEEEFEGVDINEKDGSDEPAVDLGPSIQRMTQADVDEFMSDRPFLVHMNCLLKLAHTNIKQICTECQSEVNLKTNKVGSALYLTWMS